MLLAICLLTIAQVLLCVIILLSSINKLQAEDFLVSSKTDSSITVAIACKNVILETGLLYSA